MISVYISLLSSLLLILYFFGCGLIVGWIDGLFVGVFLVILLVTLPDILPILLLLPM